MRLKFTVKNSALGTARRLSAKMARGLEPYSGPLADRLREFFGEVFDSAGVAGGTGPWMPLSPATIRRWGPHMLNQFSGTLWASLTQENATGLTKYGTASDRVFGYAVLSPDRKSLSVGTWDPITTFTERGTRHQPPRPIQPTDIPDRVADDLATIVATGLQADTP